MILDKIFYKLGFAKIKGVQFDPLDEMQAERDRWFKCYDREVMMHKNTIERAENLEKEIAGFETMEFELREQLSAYKQKYADELQKRLELVEILAESEIVIKAGEGETKTLWHDAKENPPKNSRDVLIWSETGADIGYYGDTMGWIRKDGVIIDVKFWSEFSEPVVPKTVAKEADNMVAD